ncbi:MAG: lipid-A-disaccharide synthase [Verrucomicrobiota bacterium]|jgi:lipid-A-disaccharide synthase
MEIKKEIWIIAGESSGDLYGAELALAMKAQVPDLRLRGMGSGAMRQAGVDLIVDSSELGVMGLVEVLKILPTFWRVFHQFVDLAAAERPAAVILIDYPGFNLRYAKKLEKLGIPVIWYISPQVWAWGAKRIPTIKRVVKRLFVIFPFEVEFWKKQNYEVEFHGHPLVELLSRDKPVLRDPDLFALLPGSRRSEIERLLEPFVRSCQELKRSHPKLRFVIPSPRESLAADIRHRLDKLGADPAVFQVEVGTAVAVMRRASTGLASSGTVTIQAAIVGLPLVSAYKMNPVTVFFARRMVKLPFFTMPNIIAGREVYPEFLQGEVIPAKLVPALEALLPGGMRRSRCEADLAEIESLLGGRQGTLGRTAAGMLRAAGITN